MNKPAAIFFTVLYTLFLCFAVLGVFAADGQVTRCAAYKTCVQHTTNDVAATADETGCNHTQLTTVPFYHKQNNSNAAGKTCLPAARWLSPQAPQAACGDSYAGRLCTSALAPPSCPLFIFQRSLLL